ncbi:lipopolysaccharide/colanic/teichoic acid biosynthesis glycosyltransferase [Ulvibacter sp. MAR_2010_11]|uniref:sugar transferase n=1 Tax=Ulvibacter sp. MAR_2010_11 TaxID=1250229 RepID=UPI000C2BBA07|nr:sugar transferase [Ulvibacter sp. MAR_2010_11]PKA84354.1 lipopolysaccharide/colanic/teichoic acid biosynthesis glycosyltransferase [Ulvibacter sp. MAR_2010_11]
MYRNFIKPIIDFLTAFVAIIVLSPVFIAVTVILAVSNSGNPFFIQRRPGKDERIFSIVKFKTMTNARDAKGELLSDEKRLTGIGKWIRSTSIDEIPQLFNVLMGDMSLVGPRPLLPEYLSLYSENQKKRHQVKPGITGWAQVNGRNAISWDEKLNLDIWYVEHLSFLLDFNILIRTVKKVFNRDGISTPNEATTTRFKGNKQ